MSTTAGLGLLDLSQMVIGGVITANFKTGGDGLGGLITAGS
jgi:hypothetical protein